MQLVVLILAGLLCASSTWATENSEQSTAALPKRTVTDWGEGKSLAETSQSFRVINGLTVDLDKTVPSSSPSSQYLSQATPDTAPLSPVAAEKAAKK